MKDETVAAASGLPFETWISRSLAACLFVPLFLPPAHAPFRAALRPWVLFHVERGLQRVRQLQALRYPLLNTLCSWACLTVSVEFYVTFLPLLFWTVSPQLGWRLVFLLAFALYVGNAMKDLVCAPRPVGVMGVDGKPVVLAHLQTSELATSSLEYGLPSSHTLNSCVLNYYMIYFSLEEGLISTHTGRALYVIASVWIAFIAFARLYLGMHTPIDVLAGMLGGVAVLNFFITVDDALDGFVTNAPPAVAVPVLLLAAACMLRGHPRPLRHTPSYEYSVSFVGVAFGIASGLSWTFGKVLWTGPILGRIWASGGVLGLVRRIALGAFTIAAGFPLARRLSLLLVPPLYLFFPMGARRLWQPPMHSLQPNADPNGLPVDKEGEPWDVEITARFVAFASIGWAMHLSAIAFSVLEW